MKTIIKKGVGSFMKWRRVLLIIVHFVANTSIQIMVIGSSLFYDQITLELAKHYHIITLVAVFFDIFVVVLFRKWVKRNLRIKEFLRIQFIDWPVAVYGFISVFFLNQGDFGIVSFFIASIELLWLTERVVVLIFVMPNERTSNNTDEIIRMLDMSQPLSIQEKGIKEAKEITFLWPFIMPPNKLQTWENCAKIVADRTDEEIEPYLSELFQWTRDLNKPGSNTVYNRLAIYPKDTKFRQVLYESLRQAQQNDEKEWMMALNKLESDENSYFGDWR